MAFSLAPDKTIGFGSGMASASALLRGWSKPEKGQVWSDGPHAALGFQIAEIPQRASVVLRASPFLVGPMVAQRLLVHCNGLYLGAVLLEKNGEAIIAIPSYVVASVKSLGGLELAFAILDCRPGTGTDRRLLGFALHTLQIRTDRS